MAHGLNRPPEEGMLMVDGERQIPNPESALHALMSLDDDRLSFNLEVIRALEALLRQRFQQYSPLELESLTQELKHLYLESNEFQIRMNAGEALLRAGKETFFIPLYETIEYYPKERGFTPRLLLHNIRGSGGIEYVRNVFSTSEKPPVCMDWPEFLEYLEVNSYVDKEEVFLCPSETPWCWAGAEIIDARGGPTCEEWHARCKDFIPKGFF